MRILKTDSKNEDFRKLTELLDENLYELYGEDIKIYSKQNSVDYNLKDVIVIYIDDEPVACGASKEYDNNTIELKRIFVKKANRGQGLSKLIVKQIEELGRSDEYRFGILQTGRKQIEAIKLYERTGYEIIENYGVYIGDDESVCMKKAL
ncbi:GNAT family N-acetyltransferase [Clostridium sp. YIM B02505]|uniref:GNAT family N-acetyltransferase n=1 Tax=Clostridium yunnanense TaxID=2800325 RepID=A0ABS1ESH2_9CLOT|nr:GNAT family N-acetyltransferase [Clostridium yunnanense]MBK1812305.1 GNAT family N-acetyltransferase [Clostridium yunnanense]